MKHIERMTARIRQRTYPLFYCSQKDVHSPYFAELVLLDLPGDKEIALGPLMFGFHLNEPESQVPAVTSEPAFINHSRVLTSKERLCISIALGIHDELSLNKLPKSP